MKKILLLCTALALAGCSSAPSEGDIEDFLESRFAPCKNIKVVDITKTNGYEQDGYYRVEFTYAIKQKNPAALKDFVRTYEQEKQNQKAWEQTLIAYHQHAKELTEEVRLLEEDHYKSMPKLQQFFGAASPTWAQQQHFSAVMTEWKAQNPPPALIKEKKDELNQTYDKIDKTRLSKPSSKVYQKADSAVIGYYLEGCPLGTRANFIPTIFPQAFEARNAQNEQEWFKEHELKMKAAVSMRKTENGWRALSGG